MQCTSPVTRRFYHAFYQWARLTCSSSSPGRAYHISAPRLQQQVERTKPQGPRIAYLPTRDRSNFVLDLPPPEPSAIPASAALAWCNGPVETSAQRPLTRLPDWNFAVRYRSPSGVMLEYAVPSSAIPQLQERYGVKLERLKEAGGGARIELGSVDETTPDRKMLRAVLISGTYVEAYKAQDLLLRHRGEMDNHALIGREEEALAGEETEALAGEEKEALAGEEKEALTGEEKGADVFAMRLATKSVFSRTDHPTLGIAPWAYAIRSKSETGAVMEMVLPEVNARYFAEPKGKVDLEETAGVEVQCGPSYEHGFMQRRTTVRPLLISGTFKQLATAFNIITRAPKIDRAKRMHAAGGPMPANTAIRISIPRELWMIITSNNRAMIKRIRQQCGCEAIRRVEKDTGNPYLLVTGTAESIQLARTLVREIADWATKFCKQDPTTGQLVQRVSGTKCYAEVAVSGLDGAAVLLLRVTCGGYMKQRIAVQTGCHITSADGPQADEVGFRLRGDTAMIEAATAKLQEAITSSLRDSGLPDIRLRVVDEGEWDGEDAVAHAVRLPKMNLGEIKVLATVSSDELAVAAGKDQPSDIKSEDIGFKRVDLAGESSLPISLEFPAHLTKGPLLSWNVINRIERQSGATKVTMQSNSSRGPGALVVHGSEGAKQVARELLDEIVAFAAIEKQFGALQDAGEMYYTKVKLPEGYGPFVTGRHGDWISRLRMQKKCRMSTAPGPIEEIWLEGPREAVEAMQEGLQQRVEKKARIDGALSVPRISVMEAGILAANDRGRHSSTHLQVASPTALPTKEASPMKAHRNMPKSSSELVRKVMRTLTHPVVLITAKEPSLEGLSSCRGVTVSSFTTVTLQPDPIFSFNLKLPSRTWDALTSSKNLLVHILTASPGGAAIAHAFAQGGEDGERATRLLRQHKRIRMLISPQGKGNAPKVHTKGGEVLTRISCELMRKHCVFVGDHVIVVAKMTSIGGTGVDIYRPTFIEDAEVLLKDAVGLAYARQAYRALGGRLEVEQLPDLLPSKTSPEEIAADDAGTVGGEAKELEAGQGAMTEATAAEPTADGPATDDEGARDV